MSLEQWRRDQWLKAIEAKLPEIEQLFAVVDREIKDASINEMSVDGRFMHAYDAALNLCAIALRASGYVVGKGQGHHKKTIESLAFTLGSQFKDVAEQIEIASRLRGQAMYDHVGVVEEKDAVEFLQTTKTLYEAVVAWIKKFHPLLLPRQFS